LPAVGRHSLSIVTEEMALNAGRLPTAYDISLPLLPSSEDNYIVFECTCQWSTWCDAMLEEMICLLYDVDVEPMTLTVD
jgi:hypothetical protein